MTFNILDITAHLLPEYEKKTRAKKIDIAERMGISASSYYRYRRGEGNICSEAAGSILTVLYEDHPKLLMGFLLRGLYEAAPDIFCDTLGEFLSEERLIIVLEKKKEVEMAYGLVLSGYGGNNR